VEKLLPDNAKTETMRGVCVCVCVCVFSHGEDSGVRETENIDLVSQDNRIKSKGKSNEIV